MAGFPHSYGAEPVAPIQIGGLLGLMAGVIGHARGRKSPIWISFALAVPVGLFLLFGAPDSLGYPALTEYTSAIYVAVGLTAGVLTGRRYGQCTGAGVVGGWLVGLAVGVIGFLALLGAA